MTRARDSFTGFVRQFVKELPPAEIVDDYFASVQAIRNTRCASRFGCARPGIRGSVECDTSRHAGCGGDARFMMTPDYLRQEIVQRISGARLVVIDSGHEIPIERPTSWRQ